MGVGGESLVGVRAGLAFEEFDCRGVLIGGVGGGGGRGRGGGGRGDGEVWFCACGCYDCFGFLFL